MQTYLAPKKRLIPLFAVCGICLLMGLLTTVIYDGLIVNDKVLTSCKKNGSVVSILRCSVIL